MMKILYRREELRPLAFTTLTFILGWALLFADLSAMTLVFIFPFAVLALFFTNCINHNSIHFPVFRSKVLQKHWQLLLSLVQGHSSHRIFVPHNLNHHPYLAGEKDWMNADRLCGQSKGMMRIFKYILQSLKLPDFEFREPPFKISDEGLRLALRREKLALYIQALIAMSISAKTFFLLILPAQLGAICLLMMMNLLQHDACDLKHPLFHSRNFTNGLLNWLTFNNGYHTAHHLYPGIHWSDLPGKHQLCFAGQSAPKDILCPSLFSFVFRNYLWPRSREGSYDHMQIN